jgi:eukaryotic translation initiation factor 2C
VVGTAERPVYLPFEVCELIPGQKHCNRLNDRQTAEMIKFTCQPPATRLNKIIAGIDLLHLQDQHDDDYLAQFGITICKEMTVIDGLVLKTPTVSYHPLSKDATIVPSTGTWNLKDKMVAQGVTLSSWSVIVFGSESQIAINLVQKFITLLTDTMNECGVCVSTKPSINYENPKGDIQQSLMNSYRRTKESKLIVCILPNSGVGLYSEIKRVGDTVIGVSTQCIQMKHMVLNFIYFSIHVKDNIVLM